MLPMMLKLVFRTTPFVVPGVVWSMPTLPMTLAPARVAAIRSACKAVWSVAIEVLIVFEATT